MQTHKRILYAVLGVSLVGMAAIAFVAYQTKSRVEEAFHLNQQRKAEGYELSWFEFEMLAAVYRLDHGDFMEGLSIVGGVHDRLSTTKGLVKIPDGKDDAEILDFYKSLQNPVTGAFYPNAEDPLFAYVGVTANMINHIADLSENAGEPFRLKYPLRFLDRIDTPETLHAFLDDASITGWIGSFVKPPFISAIELRDIIELSEELGFHSFSEEWKQAFRQWFIDNQDPNTGLWGARKRGTGKIIDGGSVEESQKVVKLFVDKLGNDKIPGFPLPNKDRIFASLLDRLTQPMPEDLDRLHEWILKKDRGIRTLTRHLWKDASADHKQAAKRVIEDFIAIRFDQYFVEADGAFSLYPGAEHADLDGTGEAIGMYKYIGALSAETQRRLWGSPGETVDDLGSTQIGHSRDIGRDHLALVLDHTEVNSVRFYRADPHGFFLSGAAGVHYPKGRAVMDTLDLLPRVKRWLETTDQRMGNWIGKESIFHRIGPIDVREVPVFDDDLIDRTNPILNESGQLVAVGFDVLQVPRVKIVFTCAPR